ncbi:MAG TPA: rod-binding protein [Xanthobacteraceae bacterium]|jgi:Rod binding domain-containing protein|nr:rod-binding protein [Xanthobacteraceae bacterium]
MTSLSPIDLSASLSSVGDAATKQAQAALNVKSKAKQAAQNFEANFLGNMFQEMFTGIDGDGPFGGSGALKIWRSFMTDQMAKSFAKAGGIGIAPMVYSALLKEQGLKP